MEMTTIQNNIYATIPQIFKYLNSETAIVNAGFLLGFMHASDKIVETPLSTIFNASIQGALTSIGASIVGGFLPSGIRFIIPVAVFISCNQYLFNKKDKKESKDKKKSKDKKESEDSYQINHEVGGDW